MELLIIIVAVTAAAFALLSGIIAFVVVSKSNAVVAAYKLLKKKTECDNIASHAKHTRTEGLLTVFSNVLIDLAYCKDSNELNWKLHHIRSVADILRSGCMCDNNDLYKAVVRAMTSIRRSDRAAILDIIDDEMKHYFALSDKEFPIVSFIRAYDKLYGAIIENCEDMDERIAKIIQDVAANANLNFAMVDSKAEAERTAKRTKGFGDVLKAQQSVNDLVVEDVEDEEVNHEQTDQVKDKESEQVRSDAVLSDGCLDHEEAEEPAEETPEAADPDVIVVETDTEEVQG